MHRASNGRLATIRRDDVFCTDTAMEFRTMMRAHFKVETAIESIRVRLHNLPGFNLYEAFNSVDLNTDGRISVGEIKRLVESRGFYCSQEEAEQVLCNFDSNSDGSITFSEVSKPIKRC